MIQTLSQALEFIHSCNKFGGKKDDLSRMRTLMEALGLPERLYPIVHIAGTNGKGSTAAVCASIAQQAHLRTGLFTSPYLIRFHERIRVDGVPIDDDTLIDLTARVHRACQSVVQRGFCHPLEFEVVTAIGLLYFAQQCVDLAVVEVGIGGLLDSTNIITPCVSAITPVGYDHTALLGDTIAQIAAQKAGIIKPGRPVVMAQQPFAAAAAVMQETAQRLQSPFLAAQPAQGTARRDGFLCADGTLLHMPGAHQAVNLGCALAIIENLRAQGFAIDADAVRRGIETARWDGRCQWRTDSLLIDGAHNPAGAQALARYVKTFVADRPITLFFAAMRDKDIDACVSTLAPLAQHVITTHIMPPRGESAESLAARFAAHTRAQVQPIPDAAQALAAAQAHAAQSGGVAVVCGSLYLAGFVLSQMA